MRLDVSGLIDEWGVNVTILRRASTVDDTSPPMITHARGAYSPCPSTASGSNPPIAVMLVSTIGKNLVSPARRIASSSAIPWTRSWFVRSTSRIDVLISIPTSAMNPMAAVNDSDCPLR